MIVNDIKISKAFLEGGDNLVLNNYITVKHPTFEEILKLGHGISCDVFYWSYVYILISDPYDNMVWLDDMGIDYESVTAFDVLMLKWENLEKIYNENKKLFDEKQINPLDDIKNALDFFIVGDYNFKKGFYSDDTKLLYDDENTDVQINSEIFNYISVFLQLINGIGHTDRIRPADNNAKKILIEDMRDEQKKRMKNSKNEDNDSLGLMMAGAIHGGNGGITSLNIRQHKMYQVYSALSVTRKKMHYNLVMGGVYSGNVNSKELNNQELNWMN